MILTADQNCNKLNWGSIHLRRGGFHRSSLLFRPISISGAKLMMLLKDSREIIFDVKYGSSMLMNSVMTVQSIPPEIVVSSATWHKVEKWTQKVS